MQISYVRPRINGSKGQNGPALATLFSSRTANPLLGSLRMISSFALNHQMWPLQHIIIKYTPQYLLPSIVKDLCFLCRLQPLLLDFKSYGIKELYII